MTIAKRRKWPIGTITKFTKISLEISDQHSLRIRQPNMIDLLLNGGCIGAVASGSEQDEHFLALQSARLNCIFIDQDSAVERTESVI